MRIFREIHFSVKKGLYTLNAITLSTYKGRNLSIVLARQDGEKTFATMATLPLTIGKIVSPSMAVIMLER